MSAVLRVIRCSEVVPDPDRWVLTEEQVPESSPHDLLSERFRGLCRRWAVVTDRHVKVGRNLAVRWDRQHPQYGVDPDVYIVDPPPPEGDDVQRLRLWEPGHHPPLLAIEIVSANHPTKDYGIAPLKYAACGVGELWILDPQLAGPRAHGGPHRLQIWRRTDDAGLALVYAGDGPAWSEALHGWLRATEGARAYELSSDEAGEEIWLTLEEAERAEREAAQREAEVAQRQAAEERAAREAAQRKAAEERAARDAAQRKAEAAERRIQELEALLTRGR